MRRHEWKVGKQALAPKSKAQSVETLRIKQLNQQRETEQLRQQLELAQREQQAAQEGSQDLQKFVNDRMHEKDAIQYQTSMLKEELKQQLEEQSQEQQTRRRYEQLTQNELYELRLKLQKQESILQKSTQFQMPAIPVTTGLQQAFFTPSGESEEVKT